MTAEYGIEHLPDAPALGKVVDDLEAWPAARWRERSASAAAAEPDAWRTGDERLVMRIRLLLADGAIREGRTGEGGRLAQQVRAWAARSADGYVLACSHRVLCQFWANLGDGPTALIHALESVSNLPPDVPRYVRARHLNVLGVVLGENGQPEDSARRFEEAREIAAALGDTPLVMMIMANLAAMLGESGDLPAAGEAVRRLREFSDRSGTPLDVTKLTTVAGVELKMGAFDTVERLMRPLVDEAAFPHNTADGRSNQLMYLCRAHRLAGRYELAQRDLDEVRELARERSLGQIAADVLQEQATLNAAQGRYREAYETFAQFYEATTRLQSARRDAQARTLQALFETGEARRDSERFREMAYRDALTGLYNRRFFDERLPELLRDAAARNRPLAAAIVDLDHFKQINDTFSHDAGDLVLRDVGRLLTEAVVEPAFAARLGGEEFALIVPDTDAAAAVRLGEQLNARIRGHGWALIRDRLRVTASVGVAVTGAGPVDQSALLAEADAHLYAAKRAGRDRVVGAASAASPRSPSRG